MQKTSLSSRMILVICNVFLIFCLWPYLASAQSADSVCRGVLEWPSSKEEPLPPALLWEIRKLYASVACWSVIDGSFCAIGCQYEGNCAIDDLPKFLRRASPLQQQQILKIKTEEWKKFHVSPNLSP